MAKEMQVIEFDGNRGGWWVTGLAVLVLAIGVAVVLGPVVGDWLSAGADRAAAERELARAERIDAEARLEAQKGQNWEHSFMLWTTALAAFRQDPLVLVLGALLLGAAVGGGYALGLWRSRRMPE